MFNKDNFKKVCWKIFENWKAENQSLCGIKTEYFQSKSENKGILQENSQNEACYKLKTNLNVEIPEIKAETYY